MSNTTIFIGSILSIYYIRHNHMFWPLILAIFRLYINSYQVVIQTICGFFLGWGVGGCVQVQELVFFSREGCVVWVTTGTHAIIKPCPNLFTAKPKVGFIICYKIVLVNILCSNMWYLCLWAKFGMLQCCFQYISIILRIKLFVHYLSSAHFIYGPKFYVHCHIPYNMFLLLSLTGLTLVQKGVAYSGCKIYNHLPLQIKKYFE